MAMTITPDGRQVWIPDNIAPMLPPPEMLKLPGELGKADVGPGGGQLPPAPPPPLPGPGQLPTQLPPSPPSGPPISGMPMPRGRNMIGLGPFGAGAETAGPEQAS